MDLKTKLATEIAIECFDIAASMDALAARLANVRSQVKRAQVVAPDARVALDRPLARLDAVESAVKLARVDVIRAHASMGRTAEAMDLGVICPDSASLDGVTFAKRA